MVFSAQQAKQGITPNCVIWINLNVFYLEEFLAAQLLAYLSMFSFIHILQYYNYYF